MKFEETLGIYFILIYAAVQCMNISDFQSFSVSPMTPSVAAYDETNPNLIHIIGNNGLTGVWNTFNITNSYLASFSSLSDGSIQCSFVDIVFTPSPSSPDCLGYCGSTGNYNSYMASSTSAAATVDSYMQYTAIGYVSPNLVYAGQESSFQVRVGSNTYPIYYGGEIYDMTISTTGKIYLVGYSSTSSFFTTAPPSSTYYAFVCLFSGGSCSKKVNIPGNPHLNYGISRSIVENAGILYVSGYSCSSIEEDGDYIETYPKQGWLATLDSTTLAILSFTNLPFENSALLLDLAVHTSTNSIVYAGYTYVSSLSFDGFICQFPLTQTVLNSTCATSSMSKFSSIRVSSKTGSAAITDGYNAMVYLYNFTNSSTSASFVSTSASSIQSTTSTLNLASITSFTSAMVSGTSTFALIASTSTVETQIDTSTFALIASTSTVETQIDTSTAALIASTSTVETQIDTSTAALIASTSTVETQIDTSTVALISSGLTTNADLTTAELITATTPISVLYTVSMSLNPYGSLGTTISQTSTFALASLKTPDPVLSTSDLPSVPSTESMVSTSMISINTTAAITPGISNTASMASSVMGDFELSANDLSSSSKVFISNQNEANISPFSISLTNILIIVSVALLILILSFGLWFLTERWKNKKRDTKHLESNISDMTVVTQLSNLSNISTTQNTSNFTENTTINITDHVLSLPGFLEVHHGSQFRMRSLIAKGGAGSVYLGDSLDPHLHPVDSKIVVKTIEGENTQKIQSMFHQEVSIMYLLRDCPNVSKLLGYSYNPLNILMPFYHLGSLQKYIDEPSETAPISKNVAIKCLKDIGHGLEAMHRHGIAHCDLKPLNVLLDGTFDDFRCVITDFGIAHISVGETQVIERFRIMNVNGASIDYASPEAIRKLRRRVSSHEKLDHKCFDIYSFAILLQTLLARNDPKFV